MNRIRISISPRTAFASPMLGEMVFGQFCCLLKMLRGEEFLTNALAGYKENQPFCVVSDAFPSGYLPLPSLPSFFWDTEGTDRKTAKGREWIEGTKMSEPLKKWQQFARGAGDFVDPDTKSSGWRKDIQAHNTIRRDTATTGTGMFAPYLADIVWYGVDQQLDLYVLFDERLSQDIVVDVFTKMGLIGFGADASAGAGKFVVTEVDQTAAPGASISRMTLASCDLSKMSLCEDLSFYRIKTHFGRHGDAMAHNANPFKRPLLLARRGAVLTFSEPSDALFVGRGIGNVSYAMPDSVVHQGYAPVVELPDLNASDFEL